MTERHTTDGWTDRTTDYVANQTTRKQSCDTNICPACTVQYLDTTCTPTEGVVRYQLVWSTVGRDDACLPHTKDTGLDRHQWSSPAAPRHALGWGGCTNPWTRYQPTQFQCQSHIHQPTNHSSQQTITRQSAIACTHKSLLLRYTNSVSHLSIACYSMTFSELPRTSRPPIQVCNMLSWKCTTKKKELVSKDLVLMINAESLDQAQYLTWHVVILSPRRLLLCPSPLWEMLAYLVLLSFSFSPFLFLASATTGFERNAMRSIVVPQGCCIALCSNH